MDLHRPVPAVSNYTQTLDLVAQLCRERGYPHVRLDGSTTMNKRRKLVQEFNDPAARQFAFLLSSKAGGCGLNLVGGNRLVLFDPDWNPANDKQAAARVWRDGQRKRVFEYRFLTTGSIEEKVFQRQLSKESLQQAIGQGGGGGGSGESMFSRDELRKLFALRQDTLSDTYEQVVLAKRRGAAPDEAEVSGSDSDDEDVVVEVPGVGKGGQAQERVAPTPVFKSQDGKPAQEELEKWGHHPTVDTGGCRDRAGRAVCPRITLAALLLRSLASCAAQRETNMPLTRISCCLPPQWRTRCCGTWPKGRCRSSSRARWTARTRTSCPTGTPACTRRRPSLSRGAALQRRPRRGQARLGAGVAGVGGANGARGRSGLRAARRMALRRRAWRLGEACRVAWAGGERAAVRSCRPARCPARSCHAARPPAPR